MTTPRRRWSFSLRTLFVLVTLAGATAAWVVHQLNWIRDRHAVLKAYSLDEVLGTSRTNDVKPAPVPLRLFGEPGFRMLLYHRGESPQDIARWQQLFPETVLIQGGYPHVAPVEQGAEDSAAAQVDRPE